MDLRALPRRGQFPVAVDVTVPVEPATETGLPVGLAEISQVGFAEPFWQRPDGADIAEKSLAVFDEQRGGRIGKSAPEQGSHRHVNIALEFAFGYVRRLKILPIKIGDPACPQHIEGPAAAAGRRGNAHARNGGEHIGSEQRGVPGDRRAPVMADNGGLLFSERRNQSHHAPTGSKMLYASISAGALVRPKPRISGATTWKPAAASAWI